MKFKDRYVLGEGWYSYEDMNLCLFRSAEASPISGNIQEKKMKYPRLLDRNDAPKYRLVMERVDQKDQPCVGVNCK